MPNGMNGKKKLFICYFFSRFEINFLNKGS